MPKVKHPIVRLAVDREDPVGDIVIYSHHVEAMLTGNDWLPSPALSLAVLASDTDALTEAETLVAGRGRGLAAARDGKLSKVLSDLDLLRACVQAVVDVNVDHCDEIAQTCGFAIRKPGRFSKPPLAAYATR